MVKPNHSQINNKLPKQSQSGVALLTILIMVVLATILAVSILRYQNANLEETKLLLRQDQALQYAWSAEYFFSELLIQDAKDNTTDSLTENWAQPFPPFPVEDGVVTGQLHDEQGRFNLNTLLNENGEKNETAVLFFQAMLERLNLDPNLVEAVIDWQDADDETVGAMGAENSYYQGVQADYLAPNQMFSSAKQLQWVRGFEGENYQRIAPYISALPSRSTKININTADPFVLACLNPRLDPMTVANTMQAQRQNLETLSSFSDLWNLDGFSAVTEDREKYSALFDVSSSFFVAEIQVMLSERKRSIQSHLYRNKEVVQSYQHNWHGADF